jgi:hypothetical protein
MNIKDVEQLKLNIKALAETRGKTELEIINDLLEGAAILGHEENVEVLLEIRRPFLRPVLDEIYNRPV